MICDHLTASIVPGMICDGNRRILFINRAFLEMCGHEEGDLLGKTPGRLLQGPESDADTKDKVKKNLEIAVPFDFSITNYRKDGSNFFAGIFVNPFVEGSDSSGYFVGVGCELEQLEDSPVKTGPSEFRRAARNILQLVHG